MNSNIIIVDDDPLVGLVAGQMLVGSGFDIQLISDSLTAEEIIRREKPRLVLLDICMPGMDGITLCQKLKASPETQGITVAAISGRAKSAVKAKMLELGAADFIDKPFELNDFPGRIARLMASDSPSTQPPRE
ncbi:MAG: response regulator [Elusimicrobiota bacterium]|jgi:DNA-binding response OmpR family regulator